MRLDLFVAVCALLLSAIAAGAAVMQTRAIEDQLSATVWPYLSFNLNESKTQLRYSVANDGLGPAVLRSAVLTFDGVRKTSFHDVTALLLPKQPKHSSLSLSSLGIGEVLRAGESASIIAFSGSALAREVEAAMRRRMRITVCYCSVLGQCWTLSSFIMNRGPQQVARCSEDSGISA